MTRGKVTIADVARRAGVSTMTVSNVVNQRTQRVGPGTRERVRAAISELGYQVNLTARQLRVGRTGTVALAVPDFASGYFPELGARLAGHLAGHGLRLVMERTGGELEAELEFLAATRLSTYDGFVLSVVAGDASRLEAIGPDTPVVMIGEQAVPARFDHVLMDNVGGARAATGALLASGARRIMLLGGEVGPVGEVERSMPRLRTEGYLDAHRLAGVAVPEDLIRPTPLGVVDGYRRTRAVLGEGAELDAVFALTDSAALGVLRALHEAGLRVPDDVQVVGFDDIAAGRYSTPSLTTVDPGQEEMAEAICSLLVERVQQPESPRQARVVMPPARLVPRESTRFSPG